MIGTPADEGEGEAFLDEGAVDSIGSSPVEVGDGLEGADTGICPASNEGTAHPFAVFDVDHALNEVLFEQGVVLRGETVQSDVAQPRVPLGGMPSMRCAER